MILNRFFVFALCVLVLQVAYCQQNSDNLISDIFVNPQNSNSLILSDLEEVPTSTLGSLSVIIRCGEGPDKGVRACVPYHTCSVDRKLIRNNTNDEENFGADLIDIRFGQNTCDHPLDVCCEISSNSSTSQTSSTPPTVSSSTISLQRKLTRPTTRPTTRTTSRPDVDGNSCGRRNPDGIDFKITVNDESYAEYGEFPWMVALMAKNDNGLEGNLAFCGGSLLTPSVVLTAAHCVRRYKANSIRIRAGEWDTETNKERLPYQERDVSRIIMHDEFINRSLVNDIALLILQNPVNLAENVGTICLPPVTQRIESANCFASGWGKNAFGKPGQYQNILKKIQLPLIDHSRCQSALRNTRLGSRFILHDSFVCAGGQQGKDTCTGDGGSPLVCPTPSDPNRYVQVGIVSWGIGCGNRDVPGVYTSVSQFLSWIQSEVQSSQISK